MSGSRQRILVVTPTLGDSEFLSATVASVARQRASVWHVLSVPATRLAGLRQRFPGIGVVPDAGPAGGIYGALNAALASSSADWDWFTYINDDDLLLPGFSEAVFRHVDDAPASQVLYGDVELIDKEGRYISRVTAERSPTWIPALLRQGISPLMQQGMLFSRAAVRQLGGFDTRYRLCADLDFWLRALVGGARFKACPHRVAQFRLRAGQLSGNTVLTEFEQSEIVRRLLPNRISPAMLRLARWRYRCCNLPRYIARMRSRGVRTSYQLLQEEASK